MIASDLDARRGGGRGGRGDYGGRGGHGGKGGHHAHHRGRFAKKLCRVFGDQPVGNGTVTEYCDGIKTEIEEFMEPIKTKIGEFMEGKQKDVKDTIKAVCEAGEFPKDTREGKLCAKLQEEE